LRTEIREMGAAAMEIRPFRAFRYDGQMVGDVGKCIAPPYDVISLAQQQQLHVRSQYNIVRITKGKTEPHDNEKNNQYTRAAQCLKKWIEGGVLKQDQRETIYGYVQDFQVNGRSVHRLSFIALARLEEFGKTVRPHEQTLNGPIIDRLNLKRATSAKFGIPFMVYEDPDNTAEKIIEKAASEEPLLDFCDDDNVRHRLFAVAEKPDIKRITDMMGNKSCVIADGHHRYTTALTYSKENPNPAAKFQMLAFANTFHEGLLILATHRLVNSLEKFDPQEFIDALGRDFAVTEYGFDSEIARREAKTSAFGRMHQEHEQNNNAFAIYCGGNCFRVAVLKNREAMHSAAPDMSEAWRSLDVAVLHKLILAKLLGIGEKQLAQGSNVEYIKDVGNAVDASIQAVDSGRKQLVFFLNPTKWEQIRSVTEAGERMPQKSTYFYPKIYTGLTIQNMTV